MVDERHGRMRRKLQLNAQEQKILDNQLQFNNRNSQGTLSKFKANENAQNESPSSKELRNR